MTSVHSSLSLLRQQRVAATDMPHVRTYTSRRAAAAAARPTAAAASEEPPDDGPLADDDFVYFGLRLLIFGAAARSLCFALSVLYISDPILLSSSRMMMIKLSWTAIKSCSRNEQRTSKEGTRFSGYCIWRKWFLSMSAAATTTTAVVVLCRDIL